MSEVSQETRHQMQERGRGWHYPSKQEKPPHKHADELVSLTLVHMLSTIPQPAVPHCEGGRFGNQITSHDILRLQHKKWNYDTATSHPATIAHYLNP
jgi:hypothetical protein